MTQAVKDEVFRLRDGWYCIVNGRTFGTWETKEIARGGMQVEQRRAAKRIERQAAECVSIAKPDAPR